VVTDHEGRMTTYQYDPGGRLGLLDAANSAAVSNYEYDPLNRLASLTINTGDGETLPYVYTYDTQGNLVGDIDLTEPYTYTYDALGRVLSSEGADEGTIGYSYDPVGNRISASGSESGTTADFTYDDGSRLTAAGDASLGYDAMGVRTSLAPTTVMATSGLPRATSAGSSGPSSVAAVTAASYTYDNDLRLLAVADAAGVTRFIYDPLGAMIGYVAADGMAHYYLRDGEDIYVELDAAGAVIAHYTHGAQGVLSMWRAGIPYLLLYDGQGRVRHVMDLLAIQVVHRYGRDLLAPGVGLVDFVLPIRARGAWWFPGVGLMHYGGGVFLDPVYGVFLAKTWPWCYWPYGPFHPWRPVQRWWPWPWPWARPWGWAWPRPWPFLWPWPGAWVRPWLIWPVWPWAFRFWWPWWYWQAWWGWVWWGRWWCWHPWWWWAKWWWWPWWHPWWWWSYWWWPWWWWRASWWWPRWWWWWIWWPTNWWFWSGGWTWWCWWWWWPWPWWWWPWAWPPSIGPPPDFGDAPDPPYQSLRRSSGAAHGTWWYEWLGVGRDGEWDSRQVDRDLYDDGVTPQPLAGTLTFTPTVAYPSWVSRYSPGTPLHVHGWIDTNRDGDWSDAGEMITNWSGYPGDGVWPFGQPSFGVTQAFNVPASALGASDLVTLWLRYRLDYAQNWERPAGYVRFGEVEDHPLTIARAVTPSWNGGTLNIGAVPVVTYPISVTGVMVAIAPTTVITPVWSSTAQFSVADTGNRLQILHEPFVDGQVYTVTLSTGLTADAGYVVGSELTFTAVETMYVFLPLVVR